MIRRDLLALAAGAAAALLVGGIAWAAIPNAGTISGCYQQNEGQLRVIDSGTDACRPSEIPIAWSEAGAPGAAGAKGAKGDPGDPGRDGTPGHPGVDATIAPEPPGGNCGAGGVKVSAASGVTYVCNGLDF